MTIPLEVLGVSAVLFLGCLDVLWVEAAARRARARARPSPGLRCPYCHDGLRAALGEVSCAACRTPHHAACWSEHQSCSVHGCGRPVGVDATPAG